MQILKVTVAHKKYNETKSTTNHCSSVESREYLFVNLFLGNGGIFLMGVGRNLWGGGGGDDPA